MRKITLKQKAIRFKNTFREFQEDLINALGELIRDYGKEDENDPNVYWLDFPNEKTFYLPDYGWIGGKLRLDVGYYNGIITLTPFEESNLEKELPMFDVENIENVKYQLHLYQILANHYNDEQE